MLVPRKELREANVVERLVETRPGQFKIHEEGSQLARDGGQRLRERRKQLR